MAAASKAESLLPLVYTAAADGEAWPALVEQLALRLGADAVLVGHRPALLPAAARVWTHGMAPAAVAAFIHKGVIDAAHFSDGLFVLAPAPPSRPPTTNGEAEPARCPVPAIAVRPAEQLPEPVGTMLQEPGALWALACFERRSPAARDTRRRQLLEALLPHLQRAAALQARLTRLHHDALILATTLQRLSLGVIALSADLGVLFANPVAEEALGRGDGLHRANGRLTLGDPALQRRLKIGKTAVNHQAGLARLMVESFPPFRQPSSNAPALPEGNAEPGACGASGRAPK